MSEKYTGSCMKNILAKACNILAKSCNILARVGEIAWLSLGGATTLQPLRGLKLKFFHIWPSVNWLRHKLVWFF